VSRNVSEQPDSPRILRLRAVIQRCGLGRSAIYAKVKDGSFPKPIAISEQARGWIASEVDAWIDARIVASRADKGRS
jgi:prophage regulatory protein